ncbi:MAG: MFS transporter [Deltaproteobacteria bacterium]|nr:MAG: MFS transporter [Deltaproteobacteria bacterium]
MAEHNRFAPCLPRTPAATPLRTDPCRSGTDRGPVDASAPKSFRARTRILLALVLAANVLNYLDRQVVSALEAELRAAFDLDKMAFGALWSAFTIGYMTFAPAVGYAADRVHRPRLLALCILVWSAATCASGLVTTAAGLYAARFFIGVGEAGCLVIGPALLADAVPAHVRGRVLSLFYLGMPVGGAAGYLLGGSVRHFGYGYTVAFLVAGLPGILLASAVAPRPDPRRPVQPAGDPAVRALEHRRPPAPRDYLRLARRTSFVAIVLAQTFAVAVLAPILHYAVGFFETERGLSPLAATATLAGTALVGGLVGAPMAGIVGDRLARTRPEAHALVAAFGYAAAAPLVALVFGAPSPWVFVPALFGASTLLFACMPAVNTQISLAVPDNQRAMAYALAVFVLHLLGDMAAPPLFGRFADAVGTGRAFVTFSVLLAAAAFAAFVSARAMRERTE